MMSSNGGLRKGMYLPSKPQHQPIERDAMPFYRADDYNPALPRVPIHSESHWNVIPGLGLGSSTSSVWSQTWPNAPASKAVNTPSIVPKQVPDNGPSVSAQSKETKKLPNLCERTRRDGWEAAGEGELGEELDDLYEPTETANYLQQEATNGCVAPATPQPSTCNEVIPGLAVSSSLTSPIVDSSSSYPPSLLPHATSSNAERAGDIDSQQHSKPVVSATETSALRQTNTDSPSHNVMGALIETVLEGTEPSDRSLSENLTQARKEAKDAILRLWPLNIGYQTYLSEGVDGAFLRTLFQELGLEIESLPAPRPAAEAPTAEPEQVPSISSRTTPSALTKGVKESGGESRKDRIARLLAAKSSKQGAASSESSAPGTSTPTTPGKSAPSKPLSAKAKLLQQKMEALKRSRQAQDHQHDSEPKRQTSEDHRASAEDNSSISMTTRPEAIPQSETSSQIEPPHKAGPSPPEHMSPSSIPGLFLSYNSKTAQPPKRPVASDLNEAPDNAVKRPFGQPRKSEPFVIDVSDDEDDEDDAAMDIDSPEDNPAALGNPKIPFTIPVLRDMQPNGSCPSPRPISIYNATPTPSLPPKEDLASVQKSIDDMKRRIAEAEARKKFRESRPSSPFIDATLKPRPAGINSDTSTPRPESSRASSTMAREAQPFALPQSKIDAEPRKPAQTPKPRSPAAGDKFRSSRCRAASERLPDVERNRKTQQLKLQALRSQMLRIQKEIEAGIAEEARLKAEAAMSSSEEEDEKEDEKSAFETSSVSDLQQLTKEPCLPPLLVTSNQPNIPAALETARPANGTFPQRHTSPPAGSMEVTNATHLVEPSTLAKNTADEQVYLHQIEAESIEIVGTANEVAMRAETGENKAMSARNRSPINDQTPPSTDVGGLCSEAGHTLGVADMQSPERASLSSSGSRYGSVDRDALIETSNDDGSSVAETLPITQTISGDQKAVTPEPVGEDHTGPIEAHTDHGRTSFVPYETPLQYFRAYRFHPNFNVSVPGGLRSLTYSNKIDVKKELCPDQLIDDNCPRGSGCELQHFESMQAPDDQILLQLGGYGNYEGTKRQEFNDGLRQLLTDYRKRKIRDFQTISKGIIEYRANFRGNSSRILPLGDVSI